MSEPDKIEQPKIEQPPTEEPTAEQTPPEQSVNTDGVPDEKSGKPDTGEGKEAKPVADSADGDGPIKPDPFGDKVIEPSRDPLLVQERIEKMRRKQQKSGKVQQIQQEEVNFFSSGREETQDEFDKEFEDAMGGLSEKDLFGASMEPQKSQESTGQTGKKMGKVLQVHGPDVFVELPGSRSEGILSIMQFPEGPPEIGSEVEVHIEGYDPANGLLVLTRKGAAVEADWSSVTAGMTVEARVIETNKGGLTVDVNGIRGFMPISQIDLYRVENAEQYVNQRLLCLVTEANHEQRNLVVSRRDLLEREREEKREQLWNDISEGQVRECTVRNIKNFGAFVDLGGVDGLVPIGEMSWTRIKDPSEVVQVGQKVKVEVIRLDRDARKVTLGMKQLVESPWDDLEERCPIGSILQGKVIKLLDFGAIVELEPAVDGLVHISELAPHRVVRVTEVVQLDQEVKVQVLDIDTERRRVSLSIKAAMAKELSEHEEEEDSEEEVVEVPKPRPSPANLRGGIGEQTLLIPTPEDAKDSGETAEPESDQ